MDFISLRMYSVEHSSDQKGKVIRTLVAQVELPNSYMSLREIDDLKEHFQAILSPIVGDLSYAIETYTDNSFIACNSEDIIDV